MKFRLKKSESVILKKLILLLLITALTAFYISDNWFQLLLIQGKSMRPAYTNMQLVVLDKRDKAVIPGDVVAFYSKDLNSVLVKRVVAIPGDIVQIKNNALYLNGIAKSEHTIEFSGTAKEPLLLSENKYFVLGDNWTESKDSRYEAVGCISRFDIIGKIYPQREGVFYAGN